MNQTILSENGFLQLLRTSGHAGNWLLPEPASFSAETFLKAREEWRSLGLAELDFDGKLHPFRPLARLLYNIAHAEAALLYQNREECVHYLRGPVDLLRIETGRDGSRTLELCRPGTVLLLAKEKLLPEGRGSLVTLGKQAGDGRLETELSAAQDLPKILTAHLKLFYAQSHAEEICRKGGAWGAQRMGESLFPYSVGKEPETGGKEDMHA